jgi:hypothetical protein
VGPGGVLFLAKGGVDLAVCALTWPVGRVARPHREQGRSLLPLHFSRSPLFF